MGSSFSSSYSFNIKLYNPSPGNIKAADYFINGPLITLLLLALPRENSKVKEMYSQPFFCKVKCPGLFQVQQGVITNISVSKGVENQIGFNQRLGMVDVKIDFGFLHSHMIASKESGDTGIPTLKGYLKNLREEFDNSDYPLYFKDKTKKYEKKEVLDKNIPALKNDDNTELIARTDELNSETQKLLDDPTRKLKPINKGIVNPPEKVSVLLNESDSLSELAKIKILNVNDNFVKAGKATEKSIKAAGNKLGSFFMSN